MTRPRPLRVLASALALTVSCAVSAIAWLWLAALSPATAQVPNTPAGAWRAESASPGTPWAAVFKVEGSRLTGAVSSCSSVQAVFEILDGTIEGNTIRFKCTSGDGQRTLTLTGTLGADEIVFTWEKAVREGGFARPDDAMFGDAAPRGFVVKRVATELPPGPVDRRLLAEAAAGRVTLPTGPLVTFDRIAHADREPENWLTYSGNLPGHRHSPLTQITRENVRELELAWISQAPDRVRQESLEATPLVVDGVMYTTRNTNDVVALDAQTGRLLWEHSYAPAREARATGGGGRPNRGLAILGGTLFLGTLDAHLLAIDALTGELRWKTMVADARDPSCQGGPCYVITLAPLIVKDKVIVGVGGGEGRTRGFIAAYEADTGSEAWRFFTIPAPGEPGSDTWAGDSWKTGGAPVWVTGAFDPELNLTYWGVGNPYPPFDRSLRAGDNLYSNSVVALEADTGALRWHYQFTPHDTADWDSAQTPLLVDLQWQGRDRKAMLWANRNGLLYVLDRSTGEFLMGRPFAEVNWMEGFDANGRPKRVAAGGGSPATPRQPLNATNWNPHSYSPGTGLFYVSAWERGARAGGGIVRGKSYSAIRAFDPLTGERRWEFRLDDGMFRRGVLTTASDLLFTGTQGDAYSNPDDARRADGYCYALDARTGDVLWRLGLTGSIESPPITYAAGGRQYVAVAAGDTLFAFALRR